jgi:hypothetical protein
VADSKKFLFYCFSNIPLLLGIELDLLGSISVAILIALEKDLKHASTM